MMIIFLEFANDNTALKSFKYCNLFLIFDKEREREKRKALISEPVGEVRHTCHVGIDGTAFGLLQLDKKDLAPTSASPSAARTNGSSSSRPQQSPSLSQ
ncbi:p21-Rho-binding domain protein, partial [Necator americanus]